MSERAKYYTILKRFIDSFSLQIVHSAPRFTKLSKPALQIYAKYRSFKTIANPMNWFCVKGDILSDEEEVRRFLDFLDTAGLPFIIIIERKNYWFADISKKYYEIVGQDWSFPYVKKVKIENETLMYNYPIFGFEEFKLGDYLIVSRNNLTKLPISIDYLVYLRSIRSWGINSAELVVKIYPKEFTFDGVFLTHQIYDSGDKLTLGFLKRITTIIEKIPEINKMPLEIKIFRDINRKSELLDLIEGKYISPMCNEANYAYNTEYGNINTEARLKKIKQTLIALEKLKV